MYYAEYDSPLCRLLLTCGDSALTGVWMDREPDGTMVRNAEHPVLKQTSAWLDAYFRGEVPALEIPLNPQGTAFQKQVWEILLTIPHGRTRSYGEIAGEMARRLGKEKMSAQAVGQAVGKNPISILIPCHRVVGAKGQMTGYAGGIRRKVWLLEHEKTAL